MRGCEADVGDILTGWYLIQVTQLLKICRTIVTV